MNARALSERGSDDERDTEKFDETETSDGVASYRESVSKPREPLVKPYLYDRLRTETANAA